MYCSGRLAQHLNSFPQSYPIQFGLTFYISSTAGFFTSEANILNLRNCSSRQYFEYTGMLTECCAKHSYRKLDFTTLNCFSRSLSFSLSLSHVIFLFVFFLLVSLAFSFSSSLSFAVCLFSSFLHSPEVCSSDPLLTVPNYILITGAICAYLVVHSAIHSDKLLQRSLRNDEHSWGRMTQGFAGKSKNQMAESAPCLQHFNFRCLSDTAILESSCSQSTFLFASVACQRFLPSGP